MGERLDIVPYDAGWPREFELERDRIAGALGTLAARIDHNGSTSVPGLAAKPVIDIQVSVRDLRPLETYDRALTPLGYIHLSHPDDAFCPFFHRPAVWPHTHHVHLVESGGSEERRTLAFRDYLREHGAVAREYETLKRRLVADFNTTQLASHQAYAEAKSDFIESIIRRAFDEGYPR
jgi:GrpB-like predicted nucleotidyltransferase (UPF0157 family)